MNKQIEKSKRKRGRPKKTKAIKSQPIENIKEPELNQIWTGRIYKELNYSLEEAGRITFHTKSKFLDVVSLSETSEVAGWKDIKRQLSAGLYTFSDSLTGNTRDRLLEANEETPESWIVGLSNSREFSGNPFIAGEAQEIYEA